MLNYYGMTWILNACKEEMSPQAQVSVKENWSMILTTRAFIYGLQQR